MAISNTLLSDTLAPIYTSIGSTVVVVSYFCNTGVDPVTFNVHLVANGAVAEISNTIYSNVNLTSEDTYVMDTEKVVFDDGDSIWASASVADVVAVSFSTAVI